MYEKHVADDYGDKIRVYTVADASRVYAEVVPDADRHTATDWSYTPAQARRLAKALKKAAKRAERRA